MTTDTQSNEKQFNVIPDHLIEDFIQFESSHNLFSHKIKKHLFWNYIRYPLYQLLFAFSPDHSSSPTQKINLVRNELPNYLRCYVKDFIGLNSNYDIIFINATPRRNRIDGKLVNPYTYPLIKKIFSHKKILLIDDSELNKSIINEYPVDLLYWRPYRFIDKILAKFVSYSVSDIDFLKFVENTFNTTFQTHIDFVSFAKDHYSLQLKQYQRFYRLFKKTKPKCVVFIDNGSKQSLIEAAHELKIPTIELQHSVVSPFNIYCNYPKSCNQYNSIVSDYIFTYGDYWNTCLRAPIKPIAVGSAYLEEKLNYYTVQKIKKEKAIIIVSGSYSKDAFIQTALKLSVLLPDYTIYYKLKASDYANWRDRYPKEFCEASNIVVIDNDNKSLYDYFSFMSFQIGVNSGGLYEGLCFGLTTFILKTGWYQESKNLYENKHAFLVESAEEIAEKIKSNELPSQKLDKENIYRENTLDNFEKAIESIITKGRAL